MKHEEFICSIRHLVCCVHGQSHVTGQFNLGWDSIVWAFEVRRLSQPVPSTNYDFTNDESYPHLRIVSIRQHSMPLFNALGRKKVHLNNMMFWQWKSGRFTLLERGRFTLSFLFSCYSFWHIVHAPPVCKSTIRLPVCRTIGKSSYCSQSPNFGCLCVLIVRM